MERLGFNQEVNTARKLFSEKTVQNRPLDELGYIYFMGASKRYPSFVRTQSVYIARKCKGSGYNPLHLLYPLLDNERLVTTITHVADMMHEESGAYVGRMTNEKVSFFLREEFGFAERLMVLGIEEIDYFLIDFHNETKNLRGGEWYFTQTLEARIKEKQSLFNASNQ